MRSRLALVALSLVTSLQAAPVLGQTVGCGVPPGSERCQAWSARYNGPGTAADIASGAAISPDGSTLYVTGASPDAGGSNDAATVAYDASTGAQRWAARHVSAGGVAVTPSRDGERLFVLANAAGDLRTIAYDPADGEEVWSASYDAEGLGDTGIAVDVGVEDTRVYVTGYTTVDGGLSFDYTTIAYDQRSGEE
ncbi:MAG TPA: PQQ-binding-like beta-propeller repeat protein, partial [Actinomycetota bacterium]